MSTTHLSFALGPIKPGNQLTPDVRDALREAKRGGEATAAFFHRQALIADFVNEVERRGPAAWTRSTGRDGAPILTAVHKTSSGRRLALGLRPHLSARSPAASPAPAPKFESNGNHYDVVGMLTGTFTYDEEPMWHVTVPVGLLAAGAGAAVFQQLWTRVAWPLLRAFGQGIARCFSGSLAGVEGAEAAVGVGAEAAEAAAITGEAIAEGVTMSLAAGAGAFAGLVVLIAIPFILEMLLHDSYHVVKLYNLTSHDITWRPPYFYEGVMTMAPVKDQGGSAYDLVVPAMSDFSPAPGITPVKVAHEANFTLTSGSKYYGLGWAMEIGLGVGYRAIAILFDIPFAGENSLDAIFTGLEDRRTMATYYKDRQGKKTVTRVVLSDNDFRVTVTYDYLNGKHPGPGKQDLFLYNSVVVVEQSSGAGRFPLLQRP